MMRQLGFVYRLARGDSPAAAAAKVAAAERRLRAGCERLRDAAERHARDALGCSGAADCTCPFCVGGVPPAGGVAP